VTVRKQANPRIAGPFRRRRLAELFDAGWPHARARPTGQSTRVALAPMPAGGAMLAYMPVLQEPPDCPWDAPDYEAVTPWVCTFRDVLVHSGAGIVCTDDAVVADTLLLTDETQQHYDDGPNGLTLRLRGSVPRLAGRWLSLLGGNHDSYYHWTMDCLGRLAAADAAAMEGTVGVLVPEFCRPFHAAGFALSGLTQPPRTVAADATLRVDELVVPWSVTGQHRPHPCVRPFFERIAQAAGTAARGGPRRIYVDRRIDANRQLLNEAAVIAALAPLGFVPVRLEKLSLAEQIGLFGHAEAIVAPHGAGLVNLVYARPGCRLVELHMDGWVNWCFRHLAAIFEVRYDCVIGRQAPGVQPAWVHSRRWSISVMHVLAAVEQALAGGAAAGQRT
jgi:capsular polysaccharide biosynthesis protein